MDKLKPANNQNFISIGVSVQTTKPVANNNGMVVRHQSTDERNPPLHIVPNIAANFKKPQYDETNIDNSWTNSNDLN